MTDTTKSLKKTDFLNAVPEEATSTTAVKEQLAADGFDFLPTYADYLTEHFIESGRIQRNDDGTIQRKAGGASSKAADREVFQVRVVEGEYALVKSSIRGNPMSETTFDEETGEVVSFGWALTPNAAIKKANSHVFAKYKEDSANVKALVDGDIEEVPYKTVEADAEGETLEETDVTDEGELVEADDE